MKKVWISPVPEKDDFGLPVVGTFIDGRTKAGPWAIMSLASFKNHGVGLGVGFGQKYRLNMETKFWERVRD